MKKTHGQAVEVDEALQAAKGLFFGLKKKLNEKFEKTKKSTQPVVEKFSTGVKDIASNVTDRITKEIFDDDIYLSPEENPEELQNSQNVDQKQFNISIQDEPVEYERLIKNKIKRKNEQKRDSSEEITIEVGEEIQNIEIGTEVRPRSISKNDIVNINNAIQKACQKVDNDAQTGKRKLTCQKRLSNILSVTMKIFHLYWVLFWHFFYLKILLYKFFLPKK